MASNGRWTFNQAKLPSSSFFLFLTLLLHQNIIFSLSFNTYGDQFHDFQTLNHRNLIQTSSTADDAGGKATPPPPELPANSTQPSAPSVPPPPELQIPTPDTNLPPPPEFQIPTPDTNLPPSPPSPSPDSPLSTPPRGNQENTSRRNKVPIIVGGVVGAFLVVIALIILVLLLNRKIPIKPWTIGVSGQLQDAVVTTDVPKLKLSELQTACEDFSNIIGSFSDGTIYKGTLSTGVEIAVLSIAIGSRLDWSAAKETQFKQKMHKLSKVDHKNFLKVIGYCHEDEPFKRMLIFEYAPNGTLYEHLHVEHAEHLDWPTRLRILMGIAYCLEHMHNLIPPILHTNLDSSSVYLTDDNAAKIADFAVLNSISPSREASSSKHLLEFPLLDQQANVFNFGAIVFEIITGKFPDTESLFLGSKSAKDLVDLTLKTFQEDVFERVLEVVRQCMNPYSTQRPTMKEIVVKLREITGILADAAVPRLSPRWWAELEMISTEGN